jgi:hypothetical protein
MMILMLMMMLIILMILGSRPRWRPILTALRRTL